MFAVIDCGTTNTRVYIIGDDGAIVASGTKKVGVRDTSITGSRDVLRTGVTALFQEVLSQNNIADSAVVFAIASGMITSEIGLMDIPHLVAPVGVRELSDSIVKVDDPAVLPIGRPVYFIRGIRNSYPDDAGIACLRDIDFMRGEEVQCVGALLDPSVSVPCSIVALSSHTKVMYIDASHRVVASSTTISGQFYEALVGSTNIGKSIIPCAGETAGGYSFEQLVATAVECVEYAGLGRSMLMPRFMQVLLKTNSDERDTFVNAAIAADDLKAFREMKERGFTSESYIFYGNQARCELYDYMLKTFFSDKLTIRGIWDKHEIAMLTVRGASAVAERIIGKYY